MENCCFVPAAQECLFSPLTLSVSLFRMLSQYVFSSSLAVSLSLFPLELGHIFVAVTFARLQRQRSVSAVEFISVCEAYRIVYRHSYLLRV